MGDTPYVPYERIRRDLKFEDRLDDRPSDNPYPNAQQARQFDVRVQARLDQELRPRGVHVRALRVQERVAHERGFDVEAGQYDPVAYHGQVLDRLALAEEMSDGVVWPTEREQRLFNDHVYPELVRRAKVEMRRRFLEQEPTDEQLERLAEEDDGDEESYV